MKTKTETFTYDGLGFPLELIDVPMKKILGEWVMDIDMNKFQLLIFEGLIHKPSRLTGKEIKFMRKYLEMTTTELGIANAVSHAAVVKWEKEETKMNPTQEIYLRMFFLKCLRNKEIAKVFEEITPETLTHKETHPPRFDVKEMGFVA